MTYRRGLRIVSVLSSAVLVLGATFALPADAKKKKKPKACAAYEVSTFGEGQPVNVVTDAQTAEAPLEITVPTAAGIGTSSPEPPAPDETNPVSHAFINVQVDSKAKEAGLFVTVSHTPGFDYDLYVRDVAGNGLAYSAGFLAGGPEFTGGTGNGGHTGVGTENIDGLATADCTGYLVDIVSATTPGEDVTLTLWLGDGA